jgi:hypothetical protein
MRVLLIDDIRPPSIANRWMTAKEPHMVMVCRTYQDGLAELRDGGPWDLLLLDHDLGCFDENGREWTGYDILLFLRENLQYLPKDIYLVTSNASMWGPMDKLIERLYVMKEQLPE